MRAPSCASFFNTPHEPPGEKPAYDASTRPARRAPAPAPTSCACVASLRRVARARLGGSAPPAPAAATALIARLMGGPQRRGRARFESMPARRGALREALLIRAEATRLPDVLMDNALT